MKNIIIIFAAVIILLIAGVIFLIGNVDTIIKKGVETVGPKMLKAPVTLSDVNVSVFKGTGTITGLVVGNPEGFKTDYAFKLGNTSLELDVKSVTTDKIHIKSLIIDSPEIMYEGALGKNNNLSKLQSNIESMTAGSDEKESGSEGEGDDSGGKSKNIQIDYLKISGAKVSASLDVLKGDALDITLPVIELRDIGKDGNSTVSDAVKQILAALNGSIVSSLNTNIKELAGGKVKELKESVEEKAKEGIDKLKGLFGN